MRKTTMRRMRKRQKNLLKLGDFLQKALKRRKILLDMADGSLVDTWNRTVGPAIASQTFPFKFKNKTLFVKVSNSTWMQQLQFMKEEIIAKVDPAFTDKTIGNIYFSIGTIPQPQREESDDGPGLDAYPLKARDRRLIKESMASIQDDELKDIVRRVMTKEIIKRRIAEAEKYR